MHALNTKNNFFYSTLFAFDHKNSMWAGGVRYNRNGMKKKTEWKTP